MMDRTEGSTERREGAIQYARSIRIRRFRSHN